jgi:putative hemolysin
MPPNPKLVAQIRKAILQEIYYAFGLPSQWWGRRLFDPLFWLPTQRFALRIAQFEEDAADAGLAVAARNLLRNFVENVCVFGAEQVPSEGPLLLACNHPGAYDGLALLTGLRREDVYVVASGVDFTHSLPLMEQRLIYVTSDAGARMKAVRESLRHLLAGRAVLIFPSGLVDPDPALWPEQARQALRSWSQSLVLLLRRAPEARLVIVTASHVLAETCLRSPLTRLVRQEWQRRRLAEYLQVIQQLALGRRVNLIPRISFSAPVSLQGLKAEAISQAVLDHAQKALAVHLSRQPVECWHTIP